MHILLNTEEVVELGLLDKVKEYLEKQDTCCATTEVPTAPVQKSITQEMVIEKSLDLAEIFDQEDAKEIIEDVCEACGIKNLIDITPEHYEKALKLMQEEIDA